MRNFINKIFVLLFFMAVSLNMTAQIQVGNDLSDIDYSLPREYEIAGITVTGVKYVDPQVLVMISGLQVGELVHVIADCHIYDRHIPAVKAMLENEGYPAPKVTLDSSVTDFYQFTKDDIIIENYQKNPQIRDIPVAI